MSEWRILVGDVRASLATVEDGSVQTCVTSPPYWGLRDYGTAIIGYGDTWKASPRLVDAAGRCQSSKSYSVNSAGSAARVVSTARSA